MKLKVQNRLKIHCAKNQVLLCLNSEIYKKLNMLKEEVLFDLVLISYLILLKDYKIDMYLEVWEL